MNGLKRPAIVFQPFGFDARPTAGLSVGAGAEHCKRRAERYMLQKQLLNPFRVQTFVVDGYRRLRYSLPAATQIKARWAFHGQAELDRATQLTGRMRRLL